MKKKKLSWNWTKIIWWFIFITLAASVVFISVAMALAPSEPNPAEPYRCLLYTSPSPRDA